MADLSDEDATTNGGALRLNDVARNVVACNVVGTAPTRSTSSNGCHVEQPRMGFCYWYSKFIVRFPVLFCLILLALTAGAGAFVFVRYDLPSFDDPLKGFEARKTDIRDRTEGYRKFSETYDRSDFGRFHTRLKRSSSVSVPDASEWAPSSSNVSSDQSNSVNDTDQSSLWEGGSVTYSCIDPADALYHMRLVFSKIDEADFFNTRAIHSMCNVYEKYVLKKSPPQSWYVDCAPLSLGRYAASLNNKDSCVDVDDEDISTLKELLRECSPYYANGSLTSECLHSDCPEVPTNCTVTDAVYSIFQHLLPSGSARQIANGHFDAEFTMMITPFPNYGDISQDLYTDHLMGHSLSDGVTKICAVGGSFKFDVFSDLLLSDLKYMGIGMGLIFVVVWLYIGSLFVTFMTVLDMVMSLVLSYFFYVVVFNLPFFPFINVLAFVLIIGIGADDTFVYVDIWKKMKERHNGDSEKRVEMLQDTLHHAAVTMFVTSFTTSSALFSCIVSSITALRCLSVYAGSAIVINFVYTVTWLPAIVVIEEKYLRFKACEARFEEPTKFCQSLTKPLRLFWEKSIPTFVFKFRYLWLTVLTLLGLGGACVVFVKPKLQLPTETEFQVFVASDYMEQYDQVYKDMFEFEGGERELLPLLFIWGVVPLDNGNSWDPDDNGKFILDRSFDVTSKASQEWLLEFCRDIRNQSFYDGSDKRKEFCFIDTLKSFMESPCEVLGLPESSQCCSQSNFPFEPQVLQNCTSLYVSQNPYKYDNSLRFDESNHISGLMLSFTSTTVESVVYSNISEFWHTVENWSDSKIRKAPVEMSGGFFVSVGYYDQMYFFDLQESLATGTPLSIGLSLGAAATVLLLTTRNLLITLYAMMSIACTVFVTIGSLVLMGWELNILESTVMTLSIGLSVDFTIHYGVAYRISLAKDRAARASCAMEQLSSAIATAAFSTFIAGVVMLPSTVLAYKQIGTFLSLVMAISWVYANFFFMALCRVAGPQENCAQIPLPTSCNTQGSVSNGSNCCLCCCKKPRTAIIDQSVNGAISL
ncbi:protein dispatched homolog 1-like [Diadema setosum]|uniref:protein dispatched homolog 1-like n=1 Tax=Diadema setosum TaxID=31175 RepID=UPI003B3A34C0